MQSRSELKEQDRDQGQPRLFTVAPGAGFLDCLANAILEGHLPAGLGRHPDPMDLPDYTILLPTRRAVRAMQEAFLKAAGSDSAVLLPRMRPIGLGEEDATLLTVLATGAEVDDVSLPPQIGELERRLLLMQLVERWANGSGRRPENGAGPVVKSPAQAMSLAVELARLMDNVETENISFDRLAELVPAAYSEHWQRTLDFLNIIVAWWPQDLKAAGKLSPADRRNKRILLEADRLRRHPPAGPYIIAGVTGSVPATAELMKAVGDLAQGAIVLPGLDHALDAAQCQAIVESHPEHPQHRLLHVVKGLGRSVASVNTLPGAHTVGAVGDRNRIISEAMRPAATTDQWHLLPDRFDQAQARAAFQDVHYLAAANAQDEAEAIALILREATETPGRTAALVSPDRLLARRVAIRLASWGIRVDDSAGRPFAKTVPGAFLDLVINAAATGFEPRALMALLKHPLCRLGQSAFAMRRAARAVEIAALRAPYFGIGLAGVELAVEKAARDVAAGRRQGQALKRLRPDDWSAARQLLTELKRACAPLCQLFSDRAPQRAVRFIGAHLQVAEALAALPKADGGADEDGAADTATALWRGEAGEVGNALFTAMLDPQLPDVDLTAQDYPEFYRSLVASEPVRPTIPTHPRVFIWGPFEARLQQPDLVVLGSLNDGTWPEVADPGPWLNRPMRDELGLPSPEQQIGHATHDFTQLLGARTVYLTRSETLDGNPTVASRWLLRLAAVLTALGCGDALEADRPWLGWARRRDVGIPSSRITRPQPRPALALRPRRLSVSAVETWIANPYALFAQRILQLDALPQLGGDPDAALRGSVVHEALGRYLARFPDGVPAQSAAELVRIATDIFEEIAGHPRIAAFWIERFRRFADWFGTNDRVLREGARRSVGEVSGACLLDAPAGPFTLTARADRIDIGLDAIAITDYKTGANLAGLVARAKSAHAPQLLLEALIATQGGFAEIEARSISKLRYVSASGGEPAGAIANVELDDTAATIATAAQDLADLVARFDCEDTPYSAVRRAQFRYDYDDYAHLARVGEWGGDAWEAGE